MCSGKWLPQQLPTKGGRHHEGRFVGRDSPLSLIHIFQWSRQQVERWILRLNFFGTFALTLALSANAGIHFGILPSVVSIFNPLLALYPIYIAYLLQMAIYKGCIRS